MKIEIFAHCVLDTIAVNGSVYERQGGPGVYCGTTAKRMRFDAQLHTKFGPDFDASVLASGGIAFENALSEIPTTKFRIDVRGSERDLYLEELCEPLDAAETDGDGVILSPVFDEMRQGVLDSVSTDFLLVDPQGFLRRRGDGNKIVLERTTLRIANASAIKVNPEEMSMLVPCDDVADGMKALQKTYGMVALAEKQDISLLDGDRLYSIRIPDMDIRDTTGIGDIFCAAFSCAYLKERDPLWALCFAGGAAQAALETKEAGPAKVPERGAISTNASYFYNMIKFKQI